MCSPLYGAHMPHLIAHARQGVLLLQRCLQLLLGGRQLALGGRHVCIGAPLGCSLGLHAPVAVILARAAAPCCQASGAGGMVASVGPELNKTKAYLA